MQMMDVPEKMAGAQAARHSKPDTNGGGRGYLEPIFIVGQYKCGSTWLLDLLSAHPQVIGAAEIDLVRAVCDVERQQVRPASVEDRLYRFFDGSGWCPQFDGTQWRYRDVIARMERGETIPSVPWDRTRLRKFMHLRPEVGVTLYRRIKAADKPLDAVEAFLEALSSDAVGESHLVIKAADQIAVIDTLNTWFPNARKLLITRDGRDASISATHYQKLMNKWEAAFAPAERDYWTLLKGWAGRVDMLLEFAGRSDLYVVRYEDLTYSFMETVKPMLEWLGLDNSESLVQSIKQRAAFETVTGRARGTEANHVMRKGIAGEWKQALSPEEQEQAWQIAGKQLRALGYTKEGQLQPLPILKRPALNSYIQALERKNASLEQEIQSLNSAYKKLEQWAHALETTNQQQAAALRTYVHWLAPVLWLKRQWDSIFHRQNSVKSS